MTEILRILLESHSPLVNIVGVSDESEKAFQSAKEM